MKALATAALCMSVLCFVGCAFLIEERKWFAAGIAGLIGLIGVFEALGAWRELDGGEDEP